MKMVQRKELEKVLKKFNDEECGGGYLYFLHGEELLQMDLVEYSTCVVCSVEDIKSIEFVEEDDIGQKVEGIYIEIIEGKYECVDAIWIDFMGVQM